MAAFLLVDDDPATLNLLVKMVRMSFPDVDILTAENGTAAVQCAQAKQPDLLVLDMLLPDINGLEVCRRLRADQKMHTLPIVMITGGSADAWQSVSDPAHGADCYLCKPFEPTELAAQIRATLRIKQSEESLRQEKQALEEAFRRQTEELRQSRENLAQKVAELEGLVERQTQELIRADRLAAMGILAAGIAHEVNNPNTFIASNLQTFRMFWPYLEKAVAHPEMLSASDRERLAFIQREMPGLIRGMEEGSRRIAGIVTGMKNYLSGGQADNRVVDLREVVESALRLIWNQIKHDIEVRKEFAADLPPVFGSEQSLCQVFVNLFLNAANVMKAHRGEGVLSIRGSREDGYTVMVIQDNGPGMDAHTLQNLFNPFFTTRREHGGTGLGLFISHGIIKGHNGLIEVESQPGAGATFRVKLPAIGKDHTLAADVEQTDAENTALPEKQSGR